MKYIPDTYKNIPVITFEAELKYIYPYDKLQHLMEVGTTVLFYFVYS